MQARSLAAAIAVVFALGHAPAQSLPCYDPDFGTLVGNGDDVLFPASNLGFAFPFAGTTFTQIRIATNGFVFLGDPQNLDSRCCASYPPQFVGDPPSIAPLWTDLVCDLPGGVYFKAGSSSAVVTWHRAVEYGLGSRFTLQLQLAADGTIAMWFHPSTTILDSYHQALCGVTPGNNAPDPGSIDLTATMPYNSNAQATIYEEWQAPLFDLAGKAILFLPNGSGGYVVLDRGCTFTGGSAPAFGQGCPQLLLPDAEFYELFLGDTFDLGNSAIELTPLGGTGYVVQQSAATFVTPTNALVMNDDDLIVQTLPFSFTHPGGTVTSVGHCSNGFVWLDNGVNLATPYWPDVNDLLTQGPRICPAWVDLDPGTSGTVYYDTTATAAYFTWSQVPLYVSSASLNTFQLQLHSDGRIIIVYQALAVPADSIVGYTRGTGANDPGSIDLSVTMPFPTGTGISSRPVLLTALESPAVGRTLPLEAYSLPASTTAGFLVLGLTPASINLSGLGMTNCTQYETIDSATFFVASPPSVIQPLAIPNQTWLVGFALRAQVAVLAAGITPLGVAATNAVAITIGNY